MTDIKKLLGANIKHYRVKLGFSQAKLAELANMATNYLGLLECGKKFPSAEMIERIAKVLEIEATELFSTKNYPSEQTSQLREELVDRFDQFLRAAVKEIKQQKT